MATLAVMAVCSADDALKDVKVTTAASVDTSSFDAIVRDVCKAGMTDEEKAVALFNWFERSVYHSPTPADVNQNAHKVINVYGGALSGTQGCQMAALCRAAGFEARVTCDEGGGHTYYEVKYGGAWHGFDTMSRFFVYTRETPRRIASFEAIDKDPTLAAAAVAEKRACPGFMFHGDDPMGMVSRTHRILDYTPTFIPDLEKLSLLPGQRVTWYWYNVDRSHPKIPAIPGVAHSCSRGVDQPNPVNGPFWEPYFYASPGCHPEQSKRRMYANGVIVFEPKLGGTSPPRGFKELRDLAGPGLTPQAGKTGSAVIHLRSPYLLVGGTLSLKGADPGGVTVTVSADGGKTFIPVSGEPGAKGVVDLTPAVVSAFAYEIEIRLALPNPKAAISALKVELTFMHNKYVRPFLVPGDNPVALSAANPERLASSPVTVEYAWQEGPNWDASEIKRDTHQVKDATGRAWVIKVGGTKAPRMKALTLAAD